MNENMRSTPRFKVMMVLNMANSQGGAHVTLIVHNLSMRGFLASGEVKLDEGQQIEGLIRVWPISGECEVFFKATVMHTESNGGKLLFGARIDSFGAREQETSYIDYVQELAEDAS
jgi:hypothetical protein